jgi:hypothetical protein
MFHQNEWARATVVTHPFGASDILLRFRDVQDSVALKSLREDTKLKWIWNASGESVTTPITVFLAYKAIPVQIEDDGKGKKKAKL